MGEWGEGGEEDEEGGEGRGGEKDEEGGEGRGGGSFSTCLCLHQLS